VQQTRLEFFTNWILNHKIVQVTSVESLKSWKRRKNLIITLSSASFVGNKVCIIFIMASVTEWQVLHPLSCQTSVECH
jgi:hypothetical protein